MQQQQQQHRSAPFLHIYGQPSHQHSLIPFLGENKNQQKVIRRNARQNVLVPKSLSAGAIEALGQERHGTQTRKRSILRPRNLPLHENGRL